ncbi:TonB-dependent receptor [Altererythrobacter sp. C41]|uniref:TonB-dependent receptor n=1 Tax=Altererythrobacter sp. C41 TaxID=2806021 RepID=UPI0019324C4E|nr:TonB-dependent receptor [Altererythrobacter sp. C41]MBM0171276.1 TonB-dependent receptor [Altererythrobacter sp. C41]
MVTVVRLLTSTALALGGAIIAPSVHAQSEASDSAQSVEPDDATETAQASVADANAIVVTARRRSENLQNVPVAVTALSGDILLERGISDATQLNQLVPGLRIEAFNSPTSMNIGIRGVRPSEIAPGQDPSVGVVVGDISYGFTIGISPLLFDLESVQAIKGPQGTLFGRNTTGGVLVIQPARPTDAMEGSATIGATLFDGGQGVEATGVLNIPLADGIALRAALDFEDRDGYVRNVTNPETSAYYQTIPNTGSANFRRLNDNNQLAWRLGALFESGAVESYFLYQGTRLRTNGTAYAPTAVRPGSGATFIFNGMDGRPSITEEFDRIEAIQRSDFWSAQANERVFARLDQWAVSNVTEVEIASEVTFKNIIGYRDFDRLEQQDLEGFPFQVLEASIPDYGHEFVEEIQLQGTGKQFDWVAGLFYSNQVIQRDNNRVVLNGADIGFSENHTEADSYAAYVQTTWRVPGLDGLSLTGGFRFTHDARRMAHTSFTGRLDNQGACNLRDNGVPFPADACLIEGEARYDTPTWQLSGAYQADPDTLAYASYSRGYRAGGFNYTATGPNDFGPFDPEYVDAFELGFKRDWHFGNGAFLRTNVALFHSDYRDIQRLVVPPGGILPAIVNATTASIDGGEIEILYQPTSAAQFGLNYAYVRPDYKDFLTGLGDFSDNEFAQVSRHQISVSGKIDLPVPDSVGEVSLRGDYYYQSRVFYSDTAQGPAFGPLNSQSQAGYGILNLGVDWRGAGGTPIDLNFYVNNVLATEYRPFGIVVYNSIGYNAATIGDPRVFGLKATYRF